MKIIIWGTGNTANNFINKLNTTTNEIIAMVDNNQDVWGSYFHDIYKVIPPNDIAKLSYDLLIICSIHYSEIAQQCVELNVKNYTEFIDFRNYDQKYQGLFIQEQIDHENMKRDLQELMWRNVFNDTVKGYEWFNINSLSLGRWAIGYNYAYVLSRVLNSFRPNSILELGLGQSSKIINTYVNFQNTNIQYDIVEQDKTWISFFSKEIDDMRKINIYQRDILKISYQEGFHYIYTDFNSVIENKKYNLISIDGPWGGNYYSRIDILEKLPDILDTQFVIMLDDYDRIGEKRMINMLKTKLQENHIEFYCGVYSGPKDICIIVSKEWKFLTSL